MENELSVGHYVGVAILTMLITVILIFTILIIIRNVNSDPYDNTYNVNQSKNEINIKNLVISSANYNDIYDAVWNSSDITLQEKANFRKNFLMFGKACIGHKVKELLKEIEY